MEHCIKGEGESCGKCDACQNEAEAAHQRFLERYYGGEIETDRERQIRAYNEKYGIHGTHS